jgi:hypothetical protein
MSDEYKIHDNWQEGNVLPEEEAPPKVQQESPIAESQETQAILPEQGPKSAPTPKAIRLATISRLLEKQTTEIGKIRQSVQPLQKQLKLVETRTDLIKQMNVKLNQLQKQILQVQKENQKIRSSVSNKKKSSLSNKKKSTKSKKK